MLCLRWLSCAHPPPSPPLPLLPSLRSTVPPFHRALRYLFISLERDFHASKSYSGFCTTVSILACLPLFWYSQALIQRYGHHRLIYVAESLAVVRILLYSFLLPEFELSLYLILAVQLLHGFNFALFWSASVDAMFRFSPKDLSTSSMALLNMVYFTGGGAVGSLVWGFIY